MSLIFNPIDNIIVGPGSKSFSTANQNTDHYDLVKNTYLIINHIRLLHCNILNYMPLYIARIIINKTYILADIIKHTPGIKIIIEGILYDINKLPVNKVSILEKSITYALAVAQFPTDTLENYVFLTKNGGV